MKEGKIEIDLYKKETDRNQYLLPSSCHNKTVSNSIPFSLSLRIVRICTNPEDREKRFKELKNYLLQRSYKDYIIDSAIDKARLIPRKKALKKVNKNKQSKGPVFAITFDPRLPPMGNIEAKHWRSMTSKDSYLAEVFKRPPLVAFKRQKNLRQYLFRAKVPIEQNRPKRLIKGMTKCGESMPLC